MRDYALRCQKRAVEIEFHDEIEELFIHFLQRLAGNQAANNVDENVDRVAESLACSRNQLFNIVGAGHITFNQDSGAAGVFNFFYRLEALILVPEAIYGDFCTACCKLDRYCFANVPGTTSNDSDFSFKSTHYVFLCYSRQAELAERGLRG